MFLRNVGPNADCKEHSVWVYDATVRRGTPDIQLSWGSVARTEWRVASGEWRVASGRTLPCKQQAKALASAAVCSACCSVPHFQNVISTGRKGTCPVWTHCAAESRRCGHTALPNLTGVGTLRCRISPVWTHCAAESNRCGHTALPNRIVVFSSAVYKHESFNIQRHVISSAPVWVGNLVSDIKRWT
jgi:hypothetical protein